MEKQRVVYFDNAATTPMSNEVYREMIDAYGSVYGNPSSLYKAGRDADELLAKAREKVAKAIGAKPSEIFFTSGGSESNNWAIKCIAKANRDKGNHIITSAIEHPSVLESCRALEREGFKVTYIPVDEMGVIKYSEIVKAIGPDTILISIMTANNEVGTIQPIRAIAELAKANEVAFHTDAIGAIGAIDINVKEIGIDALSISGHKIYGPKGVGALYVKEGVKIQKLIDGGHQENDYRAGTENVPAIVGLGKAIEEVTENIEENNKHLRSIRKYFLKQVSSLIHNISLNGHPTQRLQGNASISFEAAEGEAVLVMLDREGICVSTGSACATGAKEPSHVLMAMGKEVEDAISTIRFTFSKYTTKEDIDYMAERLRKIVKKVRSISAIRIYKNKVEL
ncbi:MAG: cysteine desulfurase [Clostridia bacterium]|nr:cysteine desulfurase [Clostridia bacterium]